MLRHHGAHPVDQALRRVLSLHASHRHRAATRSRSRSVRVLNLALSPRRRLPDDHAVVVRVRHWVQVVVVVAQSPL